MKNSTMKYIMSREQAEKKLYSMWENGEIASNFTTDHSEYEYAVILMMKTGEFDESEFY